MTAGVEPKAPSKKKWLWIAGAVVLLFALIGQCSGTEKAEEVSAPATAEAVAEPVVEEPAVPKPPDGVRFHSEGDVVFADFDISDNFTSGLRKIGAQSKTLEILEYAQQEYPAASKVWVQGSFPTKDQYGNTSDSVVLNVGYDRATLDKINFDGMSYTQVWDIRDGGMVHPDLQ